MCTWNIRLNSYSRLTCCRFGSHYDSLQSQDNEDAILQFAKTKLLDNKSRLAVAGAPGFLVCLSVRFTLELTADGCSRNVARKQVEHHTRLCLAATTGFEHLVTLAGSEPLLSNHSDCGSTML